jgi:hypothetical protein
MPPRIKIKLNIKEDIWNWLDACSKISHGIDWKQQIKPDLRHKIISSSPSEAELFLKSYIKNIYEENNSKSLVDELQRDFSAIEDRLFNRMEKVTGHPIYRNNFTCFITTFPRFPYNYQKGYVWLSYKRPFNFQLSIFVHELLHFQYFAYYGESIWNDLGEQAHLEIKEAMTVIIDQEFKEFEVEDDDCYPIYSDLRKKFLELWNESNNMDDFIDRIIYYYKNK